MSGSGVPFVLQRNIFLTEAHQALTCKQVVSEAQFLCASMWWTVEIPKEMCQFDELKILVGHDGNNERLAASIIHRAVERRKTDLWMEREAKQKQRSTIVRRRKKTPTWRRRSKRRHRGHSDGHDGPKCLRSSPYNSSHACGKHSTAM